MLVSANLATFPSRERQLKATIETIRDQFDVIRIYYNQYSEIPNWFDYLDNVESYHGEDKKDNSKFYYLDHLKEPEYYFTLDDDILYPSDYKEVTLKNIEDNDCIVSYHGRVLNNNVRGYYTTNQHACFMCTQEVRFDEVPALIGDVIGTGVTAFDTRYFHPKNIFNSEYQKMSDIVFSLEAKKQDKITGIFPHRANWIRAQGVNGSIFQTESRGLQVNQIKLCKEIVRLRGNS